MAPLASIILAAGQGTRMKSDQPKVIHPILGKPMLAYTVDTARECGADPVLVVVGFAGQMVIDTMGPELEYVWQHEQLGTGHAVMMVREKLASRDGDLLVLYGDTPLLPAETVRQLVELKRKEGAKAAILTLEMRDPYGYGRIIRDGAGNITGIVEEKDATADQKKISEVNTGVYCFEISELLAALDKLSPRNAQGEYYLTDVFKILVDGGMKVVGFKSDSAEAVMGPNDRVQLARTQNYLKQRINEHWMREGVTILDPDFTYIGPDVTIGQDTVILPGTMILGKCSIGANCTIGPHTRIIDSVIGPDTLIENSQVLQSSLGKANLIGPFAFIRPGTVTAEQVKVGDFVELKNCQIAPGSKVPHLTYLGDTEVGAGVNIGAGTITCNYDGVHKHRTIIGDGAFIGCNANLVAPVKVGAGATVGAGSTITKEVPAGALGVARSRQENKLQWRSPRDRASK